MRFKLATACNDLSNDSPNDPGRSGLAWKGNYALSGRTSHARARVACRPRGASFSQSERCPHAGAARKRAVHSWTSTGMSYSFGRAPRR